MKKIAISQRVEVVSTYHETRDCLDQNWTSLLEELGMLAIPIPNTLKDPVVWLKAMQVDGVILSGGNDLSFLPNAKNASPSRDCTERALLDYLSTTDIPVLGVCRGMQMLCHYFGGQLIEVANHAATEHVIELVEAPNDLHQAGYQTLETVNSFHNWGIALDGLDDALIPMALDQQGHVEAFKHNAKPWWGIMWHPERDGNSLTKDKNLVKHIFKSERV